MVPLTTANLKTFVNTFTHSVDCQLFFCIQGRWKGAEGRPVDGWSNTTDYTDRFITHMDQKCTQIIHASNMDTWTVII